MCAQAVWREVERAALSAPLRVAVAAALVASVRNPRARSAVWSARYWEEMDRETQDKLAARAAIALILWPIMMLVGVVGLTAVLR